MHNLRIRVFCVINSVVYHTLRGAYSRFMVLIGIPPNRRRISLYSSPPLTPPQVTPSGLNQQLRSVRFFPGGSSYAVTGIEGRCGIRSVSTEDEEELNEAGKPKHVFTFRCHRLGAKGERIYAVHSVDTHPVLEDVFATCGGDGTLSVWHKTKRIRIREMQT